MAERWIAPSTDSDKKQEERFDIWLSGKNIPFETPEAEAAYKERVMIIKDAVQMKPDINRIPICPQSGHFPLEYAGISWYEGMYDYEKLALAWERYHEDFSPDVFTGPRGVVPGPMLELLDFKLYQWAGGGLREDQEYQFVEGEYMRAEEYQDLIDDPTGFFLNVYFPRIFAALKPFENFPLLPPVHEIPLVPPAFMPFGSDAMKSALEALQKAGDEASQWNASMGRVSMKIMGRGLPALSGGFAKAPFDVLGDSLRGTRGVMFDMFRIPDLLLEACERITPFMVKLGIATCKATGHLMPFIPLHKGADGFMSDEQFMTFYWPTLRKLIIGLTDEGMVPILFAEGGYNQRLEAVCDLPKGKTVWLFDQTDMARAKETIGQVSCIAGNVPLSILCTGTPDDVTGYSKKLIDQAGKDGGFIFATGAGMQGAKPDNIKAMIDCVQEFGVYK